MKTVLIDASSSILLFKAGLFDQLVTHYHVVMAPSVYDEITVPDYPGAQYFSICRQKELVRIVAEHASPPASAMGKGEADTIGLYDIYPHAFVIIDDGKGARFCKHQKIPYINALLVPKIIYFSGYISEDDCNKAMTGLSRLGRYSPDIISFAETCTRHQLAYFQIERDHEPNQTLS